MKRFLCLVLAVLVLFSCFTPCFADENEIDTQNTNQELEQFNHATLGVITGSIFEQISRDLYPEATIDCYTVFPDLFQCIIMGKIDGFLLDQPSYAAIQRTDENLERITVPNLGVEVAFGFKKSGEGAAICDEMNTYLERIKSNGTLDKLLVKWSSAAEPSETLEMPTFAEDATPLRVTVDTSRKPYCYMLNNQYAGVDPEIIYNFCLEYNYKPIFEDVTFASAIVGIAADKYDLISGGIYATDERKEKINFSEPYITARVVMITYNHHENDNFWTNLKDSFEKTLLRENRWQMVLSGILITLEISLCSIVLGTLLGILVYMAQKSRWKLLSRISRLIAKVFSRFVMGTPILVILMILYYLVLGKSGLSGRFVSIIGFSLIFSSFVQRQLALDINNVDRGQVEAAYSLGFTRYRTITRIVLPQSMEMFLPVFTSEAITLIKSTSIVGYIAVADLTKVGDIIRSSTFEAFFPLFAVALIYFCITWGIASFLKWIQKKYKPTTRTEEQILKGVIR